MNKNTAPNNLSQEFAALPKALESLQFSNKGHTVILARMLHGLTQTTWQEAVHDLPLHEWHIIPVEDDCVLAPAPTTSRPGLPVSPFREVRGVLTKNSFLNVLHREILRLGRNGGSLSVVSATLINRRELVTALGTTTLARLDEILAQTLLSALDACDGLGLIKDGVYACSLPGMGQLAARQFAERCCTSFQEAARPFCPAGGLGAGQLCNCALGIVNIMQGESCKPVELVKRARDTLEIAMTKEGAHIHQETAFTPLAGPTLVHSSEKRFLFFGGDPK